MKNTPLSSSKCIRILLIGAMLATLFSVLIISFFKLQIVEGEQWSQIAKKLHQFVVIEPFRRGGFYSNTDMGRKHPESPQSFVVDVPVFHLYIDPASIPDSCRSEITETLWSLSLLPESQHTQFKKQFSFTKSRSRKLMTDLDQGTRDAILTWWLPYARKNGVAKNALYFINDYKRSYPFGSLLGQVLHTIRNTKDDITKCGTPTGGLELYFNDYLSGSPGKRLLRRSLRNSLGKGDLLIAASNGADIYLTINHYIQAIAEEELASAVEKAQARSGRVVMIDPETGDVMALAEYPFFDPMRYSDYFNSPELIEQTKVRNITDAFEPGSIFKPITLAIALKANRILIQKGEKPLFDPLEKIDTSKGNFPGRSSPITDTSHHHFLNMYIALQKSSNIYMARLAQRIVDTMGNEWYRDSLAQFGFGDKTGIELPGESPGMLPAPGKTYANGTLQWSKPTPFSLAIGHNVLVNSVQMVRAYCTFVNGGYLITPTLVKKIVKEGELLVDNNNRSKKDSLPHIIDEDAANTVVRAMKYVTKPGGTGRRADIAGYTEAGKSGTSEKIINGKYSNEEYVASFIGLAPLSKPRFVLLVVIDEPARIYTPGIGSNWHGGTCAAPAFKNIAKRTLEYLGVASDDPYGYPVGDPRRDALKADWVKEVENLKKTDAEWNG